MQFEPCFPPGNPQPNSPLSWGGVLEVPRGVSRGGVLGKCPGGGALKWCPGVVSWNGVLGVSRGVSRGVSWLSWNVVLAWCPGWCPRLGLGGVLGWAWGDVLGWCPGVVSWGGVLAGVLGWCPGVVSWGSVPKT